MKDREAQEQMSREDWEEAPAEGSSPEKDLEQNRPKLQGRLSVGSLNFGIPTNKGAQDHVDAHHGKQSWRYRVLSSLHSQPIQITLSCLLLLDVIILFVEIFLLAQFPPCHVIERDAISCCPSRGENVSERFLASTDHHNFCEDGLESTEYLAGCDSHKWHRVHTTEKVLFGLTITILCVFMIELNITMLALKPLIFFRQLFYLLDYIIVAVSLALELTFHFLSEDVVASFVGILVIARIWRFFRIGHGLIEVATEISHTKYQSLLSYAEELEDLLHGHNIDIPDSLRLTKFESNDLLSQIERDHRHYRHTSKQSSTAKSIDGKALSSRSPSEEKAAST